MCLIYQGPAKITKTLIHHDFNAKHIIVSDNNIIGIIDFEWATVGDPLWDFQKLPIGFGVGKEFNIHDFLVGYGKISFTKEELIRLKMYCVDQGLWLIVSTLYEDHGYPKEMAEQGYSLIENALKMA